MLINLEELYSEVPPTKLRNINEKFCPSKTSPFWLWVADRFFYGMLEDRFYAFRYKGIENYLTQPDISTFHFTKPAFLPSFISEHCYCCSVSKLFPVLL